MENKQIKVYTFGELEPGTELVLKSAYDSLVAQNQINRMAAENGTKRIAELETKLEVTDDLLLDAVEKCHALETENEKLKSELDTEREAHKFTKYHHDGQGVYIDTLAKQNEELKSRSAKLVEALKFYADQSSWEYGIAYATNNHLVDSDLYCERGDYFYGGKRARKALAEHEKTPIENDACTISYTELRELRAAKKQNEIYKAALLEAKKHFDAIQSGLTTDINRVEFETKKRAHEAWVEVFNALAEHEKEGAK